jgi:hypothetical protein
MEKYQNTPKGKVFFLSFLKLKPLFAYTSKLKKKTWISLLKKKIYSLVER